MSLYYSIQEKKDPRDRQAPGKFYLIARSLPAIDRKVFIEDMVRNTSLTKNEAATALDYLFERVPHYISLGHTVKLGDLGFFRATLCSEGSDTAEEATTDKVTAKRVHFIFGKELRDRIKRISIEKYPE
jgi:predicted histone-like DNA-binding protein